jgi:hypothetical protein
MAGKIRKALRDGKLSRSDARKLNDKQLEKAVMRIQNNPTEYRATSNASNYINRTLPNISSGSGGSSQAGANTGGSGAGPNTNFAQDPILSFASGRDRSQEYNDLLTANNQLGAFDGQSWARAQNAGFSDTEIATALDKYIQSGDKSMMIGKRPMSVLDNWQNDNPRSYNEYANGYMAPFSANAQVMFNPLGGVNTGLGSGGQQDQGITWYSTQGNENNDLSGSLMPATTAANLLENGYYQRTPEGFNRMMQGESAVPGRYIGDKEGRPDQYGGYTYGYDTFTSAPAQQYMNNLNYAADWNSFMPKSTKNSSKGAR